MIPKIPLSKFKIMSVAEIKAFGSFEVTADGEPLCVVIVPQGEPTIASYAHNCAIEIGFQNNAMKPRGG